MAKLLKRRGLAQGVKFETPDLRYLRDRLKPFGKKIAAKHFASALRKALRPGMKALEARTPVGPTGNLKNAVRIKTKTYKASGSAWGAVGYGIGAKDPGETTGGTVTRGKNRGFHAHWIEFGTKERHVRRSARNPRGIASSYRRLGPFTLARNTGGRVQTSPAYPAAFFKRGKSGSVGVSTGRVFAQGPLKRAFASSKGQMESKLRSIINSTIEKAWADLAKEKAA